MHRKLLLASAGAGKSERIAKEALDFAASGSKVLLLTYTINNQVELVKHICRLNKFQPRNVVVKGWFTFLLEDMVRPYQRRVLPERVSGVVLNSSNPHLKNGIYIPGRGEKRDDNGVYNLLHFVTKNDNTAHTTFLSKLATRIHEETGGKPARRLADIYKAVFIDEVQDLVGWDFEVIRTILAANIGTFDCVGDFRQTIYQTSVANKKPRTNADKLAAFKKMGFERELLNISWRCTQSICDLAHVIHASDGDYAPTISQVNGIPVEFADHHGIFAVSPQHIDEYVARYNPIILRWSRQAKEQICQGRLTYNFGEAKGIGFNRVLILPTERYAKFLSGDHSTFGNNDSDEVRNKLYVAITRARYSVAFLLDFSSTLLGGIEVWQP